MADAPTFLERLRRAQRDRNFLSVFNADPDGFGAVMNQMPDALQEMMTQTVLESDGAPLILTADCFVSAACDRHGDVLVAGARFSERLDALESIKAAVRNSVNGQARISLLADARNGQPIAIAAGTAAMTRGWPLDPKVRQALDTQAASFAVLAFQPGDLSWTQAAEAYGLTPAEARLVAALARHGNLKRAALERDIAYETARKFVASAMRKTGSNRQTELIQRTLLVAAGDVPESENLSKLAADVFDLTERQAMLAVLVANGATRERAATVLNISVERAKSELKTVFESCGVASAVDLSRLISEMNALKGLASACDVTVSLREQGGEPLRFIRRTSRPGKIAITDHGPASALPLLMFHTNTSGRHQSRTFVAALRQAGFRPIAVERAGYGLSDPLPGDPIENAVHDVVDILDALGIDQATVVSRSTTGAMVAAAALSTGRIRSGVLLVPDPPAQPDRPPSRIMDQAKRMIYQHPGLMQSFASMMTRRINASIIEQIFRSSVAGNPLDEAVLDDPAELADLVRGAKQCALGLQGFLAEAVAMGKVTAMPLIKDAGCFTVMIGAEDQLFTADQGVAFWTAALPGAVMRVIPEAGHFLHLTHTHFVIDALQASARGGEVSG